MGSEDLVGKKFGRLTVVERLENDKSRKSRWLCKCDCGNTIIARGDHLRSGWHTQSCGCLHKEKSSKANKTHGDTGKRLYNIWTQMIARCDQPHNERAKRDYHDRGITVCSEWHDYPTFREWALENGYRDDLSIDREDNDGNYCPENCRWADDDTQANNTSRNINITFNGKTMTLKQWSKEIGVKYRTLSQRILVLGWDIDRAFTEPVDKRYSHTEWRQAV